MNANVSGIMKQLVPGLLDRVADGIEPDGPDARGMQS